MAFSMLSQEERLRASRPSSVVLLAEGSYLALALPGGTGEVQSEVCVSEQGPVGRCEHRKRQPAGG